MYNNDNINRGYGNKIDNLGKPF